MAIKTMQDNFHLLLWILTYVMTYYTFLMVSAQDVNFCGDTRQIVITFPETAVSPKRGDITFRKKIFSGSPNHVEIMQDPNVVRHIEFDVYFSLSSFLEDFYVSLVKPIDRDGATAGTLDDLAVLGYIVECRQTASDPNSYVTLKIEIIDVNDNAPDFFQPSYSDSVNELTPVGAIVVNKIVAVDKDEGLNRVIVYTLHDVPLNKLNGEPLFLLPSNKTSSIALNSVLDFESLYNTFNGDISRMFYNMYIAAQDSGTPPQSSTAMVTIFVTDGDDLNPTFEHPSCHQEHGQPCGHSRFDSNILSGSTESSVLTFLPIPRNSDDEFVDLVAYDMDTLNAAILCQINQTFPSGYEDYFIITTNQVGSTNRYKCTVTQRRNFPIYRSQFSKLEMTVEAREVTVNGRSGFATIVIDIRSTNQFSPLILPSIINGYVNENSPVNTRIYADFDLNTHLQLSFVDPDESPDGDPILYDFHLDSSTPFRVRSDGFIVNSQTLDCERQQFYTFELTIVERLPEGKSATSTINIFIVDLNDNVPIFDMTDYRTSIQEGIYPSPRFVVTLSVTDMDVASPNNEIKFDQIRTTPGPYNFFISPSGQLSIEGRLVAGDTYRVYVVASDNGTPSLSSTATVDIMVMPAGNLTCPESQDSFGIMWKSALASSVVQGFCPQDHHGNSVRECNDEGRWEEPSYTGCIRNGIEEIERQVTILQNDPFLSGTIKRIEEVSTKLNKTISSPGPILTNDIFRTVNILSDLGNLVSDTTFKEPLVSTKSLQNSATVTDKLISADQKQWEGLSIHQPGTVTNRNNIVAATLLVSLDKLAVTSLKNPGFSPEPIVTNNLVIQRESHPRREDIHFPSKSNRLDENFVHFLDQSDTTLFLPYSDLPTGEENVSYSVLLYKNLNSTGLRGDMAFEGKEVQSTIMAFSLSKSIGKFTSGLQMRFKILTEIYSKPVCGFINVENHSALGTWSDQGCETREQGPGFVNCTCNHLTNFAVLVSPHRPDSTHEKVLSVITMTGCIISIICLVVLVITYGILWRYMKKDRKVYLHLTLGVCLIIVYVIFLAGVDQSPHEPYCSIVAGLLHYFLLVAFFLMLCEGLEILLAVLYVFEFALSMWAFLLPTFGVSLFVVVLTVAIKQAKDYRSDDVCWLSYSSGSIWAFIVPAYLVILVNIIVLCITLYVLVNSLSLKDKAKADKLKAALRPVAILSPLLGLTWLFGILTMVEGSVIFQYLFALFNTLQGVAILVFQGLMFHKIKDAYEVFKRKQTYRVRKSDLPPRRNVPDQPQGRRRKAADIALTNAPVQGTNNGIPQDNPIYHIQE